MCRERALVLLASVQTGAPSKGGLELPQTTEGPWEQRLGRGLIRLNWRDLLCSPWWGGGSLPLLSQGPALAGAGAQVGSLTPQAPTLQIGGPRLLEGKNQGPGLMPS